MVSLSICRHPINYLIIVDTIIFIYQMKTKFVEYQNDGISSKVKQNYFKSAENYCEYRKFANGQLPNLKEK